MDRDIPTITTDDLAARIERGEDMLLVDTLSAESFDEAHIPTSVSIPSSGDDFVERVSEAVDGQDARIVVYCADRECLTSIKAARRLRDAGFTNVEHYPDGLEGWRVAGLQFDSARTTSRK